MDISNANQNYTITNNLSVLDITGANNNITIKSHINKLIVSGANNDIDGTDPNCLIDSIEVNGINNDVNLNSNCQNAKQSSTGIGNNISFGGSSKQNNIGNNYTQSNNNFAQFNSNMNYNMNNNMNSNMNINMNSNFNQNFGFAFNSNAQNFFSNAQGFFGQNPFNNFAQNNFNNVQNNFNNAQNNVNNAQNNNNVQNNNNNEQSNNNVQDNNNNTEQKKPDPKKNIFASTMPGEEDFSNLNEHDRKIRQLFLEMDEYQYKHIQKYESRKETECAICLEEFKGTDMIKAFYKCEHIFHKNCLRDWLKKQVVCPMCKHDLEEDIKTMK